MQKGIPPVAEPHATKYGEQLPLENPNSRNSSIKCA